MDINRDFNNIRYNLQECVGCNCKNTLQCNVCAFKRTKLDYKYYG